MGKDVRRLPAECVEPMPGRPATQNRVEPGAADAALDGKRKEERGRDPVRFSWIQYRGAGWTLAVQPAEKEVGIRGDVPGDGMGVVSSYRLDERGGWDVRGRILLPGIRAGLAPGPVFHHRVASTSPVVDQWADEPSAPDKDRDLWGFSVPDRLDSTR